MEELCEFAVKWEIGDYTIEERWNPNGLLADPKLHPHPNKNERLYAIMNEYHYVFHKKNGFVHEMRPSARDDNFLINARFTLKEAYDKVVELNG